MGLRLTLFVWADLLALLVFVEVVKSLLEDIYFELLSEPALISLVNPEFDQAIEGLSFDESRQEI